MSQQSAHQQADEGRRCSVLVIEDGSLVLDIITRALRAHGFLQMEAGAPPRPTTLFRSADHDGGAPEVLVATVGAKSLGGLAIPARSHGDAGRAPGALSPRQADVLRLVALGMTNAEIAEIRGTTVGAVASTVARALAALGIDAQSPGSDH